jgi:hypothetical protein
VIAIEQLTNQEIFMKRRAIVPFLALVIAGSAYAQSGGHDHSRVGKPLHGGVVAEAKDIEYELVVQPDSIQLHVRDHGKPIDVSKALAVVTLLMGKEQQEVELKPDGPRLAASGSFKTGPGSKAVARVTLAGKPAGSVRFNLK